MRSIKAFLPGLLMIISILFVVCQHHPTSPEKNNTQFTFKLNYVDSIPETNLIQPAMLNINPSSLQKQAKAEAVDQGHVLVLDFSEYADLQEFRNSEKGTQFVEAFQQIDSDSILNWSQWAAIFDDIFTITDNKSFSIENDTAYVSVTGVSGLNYFVITLTEDDLVRYEGEAHSHGKEESHIPIQINLASWGDYTPNPTTQNIFEVVATIDVGENPDIPALSPNGDYLYVANQLDSSISIISTASNSVIKTLNTGWFPRQPVITPDGEYVYVPILNSSKIEVISITTNTIVDSIVLGNYIDNRVDHIAFTPDGSIGMTTSWNQKSTFIQPNGHELLNTITFGSGHRGVIAGPNNNFFFVADYLDQQIHVIAAQNQSLHQSIDVGSFPRTPTLTPDGTQLYVSNEYDDNIMIIDLNSLSVQNTITAGDGPQTGTFTSDGQYLIVPNFSGNSVSIIATASGNILEEIAVDSDPYEGTISNDDEYAFIPCWNGGLSVISIPNRTLVETITTGTSPQKPVISEDGTLYTTNYNSNTVSVIQKRVQ